MFRWKRCLAAALLTAVLLGCGVTAAAGTAPVPAAEAALLLPEASGIRVKAGTRAEIDYSNTADGYVMVRFTGKTTKRLKVQVKSGGVTYTYDLAADGEWDTYPLSQGSGNYQVTVYENISGTRYSTVMSLSTQVTLTDEFAPFLRPNQYVDYAPAEKTVAKAAELTAGKTGNLKKVEAIYNFVVQNLTYDYALAASVQSGYLPVLDTVLEKQSGICFDYAALMTGMLRSQGVPCKLVVGYAGTIYHAWISVYSEETGWVEGAIYFDGTVWKRMDPTFASTGRQSSSIMEYIRNDQNYVVKYLY